MTLIRPWPRYSEHVKSKLSRLRLSKVRALLTDRQTHRHTDTQTAATENITTATRVHGKYNNSVKLVDLGRFIAGWVRTSSRHRKCSQCCCDSRDCVWINARSSGLLRRAFVSTSLLRVRTRQQVDDVQLLQVQIRLAHEESARPVQRPLLVENDGHVRCRVMKLIIVLMRTALRRSGKGAAADFHGKLGKIFG